MMGDPAPHTCLDNCPSASELHSTRVWKFCLSVSELHSTRVWKIVFLNCLHPTRVWKVVSLNSHLFDARVRAVRAVDFWCIFSTLHEVVICLPSNDSPSRHSGLFTIDVEFHLFLDVLCEFTDPSCGTLLSVMRCDGQLVLRFMLMVLSKFVDDPQISWIRIVLLCPRAGATKHDFFALSLSWSKFAPHMLNTNVSRRANVFMLRGHIVR